MNQKKERCREAMFQFYQRENLFRLYKTYLLDWIAEGYIGKELDVFSISMIGPTTEKETFLSLLEEVYFSKEIFQKVFTGLDQEVQKIFETLAWGERYYLSFEEKEKYYSEENRFLKELSGKYSFFRLSKDAKNRDYFELHYDILRYIRQFMKKPKEIHLQAVHSPKYMKKENNEEEILENLTKYFEFYEQGGIALSSSGKILKESKLNMKKYCNISEYYIDAKDLDYLKTETISLFFFLLKDEYKRVDYFQANNIKTIVQDLLSTELVKEEKYAYCSLFLNFLKGVKNIWQHSENLKECFQSILEVLEELESGMLVSVDNIIKSILFQDKFYELIDIQDVKDYIYINEANYERTRITNYDRYRDYIVIPFIKSFFFLLGTLGIFELYYNMPDEDSYLYLKNGYLSKYDGLQYIRLTKLGEYVLGKTEHYEFKKVTEESEILLDEEHLIITLLGDAPTKTMFLERIGQKIASNKYKVTKESFLRNLEENSSLQERIEEFHSKIPNPKPQIWIDFLEELAVKSRAIIWKPEYRVLKLKEDKELISIVSKDKRFQEFILRGEEYHIFVKEENMGALSKLFKEYGYYMNW
ncbi:hypothetical protein [Fusobacterium gonidiaformans]|uniref:hypothetical protein n=1 Tax=Fusobacterium gonidiaformans TaxID=849 RepID=UPI0001BC6228|nr:hypothetical protein [Fusobacterium gonidiaformans]AVQ17439.1 hypothetical protein C4N16_07805 [Fusobacterium gonidiaformans ATCC 25563]EFS27779.2 hypothetical protein FGAG_00100 [Fusobacterium gonidiaformans ATCC 25563]